METAILPQTRPKLTQRRAAAGLVALALGIPVVPALISSAIGETRWEAGEVGEHPAVTTSSGTTFAIDSSPEWQYLNLGDTTKMRRGEAEVTIHAVDLEGRDPGSVAQRLIRASWVDGLSTTLDGGTMTNADGTLSGPTCVAVTRSHTGSCAYLNDDDVMIFVESVGTAGQPAWELGDIVDTLSKEQDS